MIKQRLAANKALVALALLHDAIVGLSIKVDGCPKAGDFVCHSVVDLLTIEADGCPEIGAWCATRLGAYPSRLMDAPRLETLFATWWWTY